MNDQTRDYDAQTMNYSACFRTLFTTFPNHSPRTNILFSHSSFDPSPSVYTFTHLCTLIFVLCLPLFHMRVLPFLRILDHQLPSAISVHLILTGL